MQTVCPQCHSSAVFKVFDSTNDHILEELLSPAAIVGLSIGICKALKVPPVVGVVAGTAIAAAIAMARQHDTVPLLVNKQYRCRDCLHEF